MPQNTNEFGKFGAQGIKGSEAVGKKLDDLAGGIATPATERRGLMARVRYLTRSDRQKAAAREAGLSVSDRTVKRWLSGESKPSKKSLAAIESAYKGVRRKNVARSMKSRLNRDGRGTRVEMHPQNQSQVVRPHQRALEYRNINVRNWDGIVDAWADDDTEALSDEWEDKLYDLGSDWGAYEHVTAVGFSA